LAHHFAGLSVEGTVQRQRAVAGVFEAMALGTSGGERQHPGGGIQGPGSGLFVYTKDRRARWRIEVKPNNISRLRLKVRIVGGHVMRQTLRLQRMLSPHPGNHHVRDSQLFAQLARTPVGGAVGGQALLRPSPNPRPHFGRACGRFFTTVARMHPGEPFALKAALPTRDEIRAAGDKRAYLIPTQPVIEQQQRPGPLNLRRRKFPRPRPAFQFSALRRTQLQPTAHWGELYITLLLKSTLHTTSRQLTLGRSAIVSNLIFEGA